MTETVGARAGARKNGTKGSAGVKIERIYTTPGVHPYDEVTWEKRDVVQQNWKTGETIFEQRGVEFPDFWSINASTIVTTLQSLGSRELAPTDCAFVTFGRIEGGISNSYIGGPVVLEGCIRYLRTTTQELFHRRVREVFLELAAAEPGRYLVLDAAADPGELHAAITARLAPLLERR